MVAGANENGLFGRRGTQHVLILASGDRMRHMVLRPWMTGVALFLVGLFMALYLGATGYLVLRDDLIGAAMARQARMQHDYEDRIAALRAQLDRITSRQLLDQQLVEQKVEDLLERQSALADRHGRLGSLLSRAGQSGLDVVPPAAAGTRPVQAKTGAAAGLMAPARTLSPPGTSAAALGYSPFRNPAPLRENVADRADRVFSTITHSLKHIERQQFEKIAGLTGDAARTAAEIEAILRRTGIDLPKDIAPRPDADTGIGGPYLEPLAGTAGFEASLDDLDTALTRLEAMRETARDLPFESPAPGAAVTSRFGNRVDPFFGRLAMHAGIDFRAATGHPVRAAGSGKVVASGYSGGYGNMVEIDHGFGITTRYGHMSKLLVREGQRIAAGDLIGQAGSTGRSTGPHIHYEVRRDGEAVDPARFLNAGAKLAGYLE